MCIEKYSLYRVDSCAHTHALTDTVTRHREREGDAHAAEWGARTIRGTAKYLPPRVWTPCLRLHLQHCGDGGEARRPAHRRGDARRAAAAARAPVGGWVGLLRPPVLSPLRRPRRRCSRRCPGGRAGCTRRGRGRTSDRHRTSWCLVVARRGRGRASPLCASKICCVSLQPALSATANALSKLAPWRPICAWMGEGANVGRGAEFRTGVSRCKGAFLQCGAQPRASQGCIGLGRAWDTRRGGAGSDYWARTSPSPQGAEKVRKKEGGSQTHAHRASRGRPPLAHQMCGVVGRGDECGWRAHLGARHLAEGAEGS